MIAIDRLTDEQFERHALDLLKRELGARDREDWQKDSTLEQILESIRVHREPPTP